MTCKGSKDRWQGGEEDGPKGTTTGQNSGQRRTEELKLKQCFAGNTVKKLDKTKFESKFAPGSRRETSGASEHWPGGGGQREPASGRLRAKKKPAGPKLKVYFALNTTEVWDQLQVGNRYDKNKRSESKCENEHWPRLSGQGEAVGERR